MIGKMCEVVFELLDVLDRFWGKDNSMLVERCWWQYVCDLISKLLDPRCECRKDRRSKKSIFLYVKFDPGVDLTRQLCWWLEPIRLLYEGQGHLKS